MPIPEDAIKLFCYLSGELECTLFDFTFTLVLVAITFDSAPSAFCAVTAIKCVPGRNIAVGLCPLMPFTNPRAPSGTGIENNLTLGPETSYTTNCLMHVFNVGFSAQEGLLSEIVVEHYCDRMLIRRILLPRSLRGLCPPS